MNYKFTVFTSVYNGAKTVHRVFDSMMSQAYPDFEWIIINDGSTDESDSVIKSLIGKSGLEDKITYLTQVNLGKHVAWNRAVALASGDFFVSVDCDDGFAAESLNYFNQRANELKGNDFCRSNLSGITVCAFNPKTGELVGTPFPEEGMVSDEIELVYKYHITGDKWGCVRVDLLKQRPFPELKGHYYNESFLWFSLSRDGYQKANYNKLLLANYYEAESLSHSKSSRYDSDKAVMQMSFECWRIRNVGRLIWKYSKKGYLKCYVRLDRAIIKWIVSKIVRHQKR